MHRRHETANTLNEPSPARQRIDAAGHIASKAILVESQTDQATNGFVHKRSRVATLDQQGSARIGLPYAHGNSLHAILINTAGGLTGNDRIRWSATAGEDSHLVLSTAACEKLYRSHGPAAHQSTHLVVEDGARLDWLPQETILFNGARLQRNLTVEMSPNATALIGESFILGRQAMRENIEQLQLHDSWRIHRHGKLLHAEELDLQFDDNQHARHLGNLHQFSAIATLIWVSPFNEDRLQLKAEQLRATVSATTSELVTGISAMQHRLLIRALASDSLQLRRFLIPCIELLCDRQPIPPIWNV